MASIREGNRVAGTFIRHEDDAMPAGSGERMIAKRYASSFEENTDIRYGNVDCIAELLVNHTNLHLRSLTYPGRVSDAALHHPVTFPTLAGRQEDS